MKSFEALATTPERQEIRTAIRALCDKFDDSDRSEKDRRHQFPHEFAKAVADGGWRGIAMPKDFGGSGMGIMEAAILMQEIGHSAGSFAACSTSLVLSDLAAENDPLTGIGHGLLQRPPPHADDFGGVENALGFQTIEQVTTPLAPVWREMTLCFIAEKELGLPKSY